jgi:hypothetical protein
MSELTPEKYQRFRKCSQTLDEIREEAHREEAKARLTLVRGGKKGGMIYD